MKTCKLLSFILAAVTLLSAATVAPSVGAVWKLKNGDFMFKVLNDGNLSVEEYTGNFEEISELKIPSSFCGYKVTKIERLNRTFRTEYLDRITIPDSITEISPFALDDIVTDVLVIGKNVCDIKFLYDAKVDKKILCSGKHFKTVDNMLYNSDKTKLLYCPKLKKLNNYKLPDSVKTIDKYAFYSCDNLKSVRMNNVRKINDSAFEVSGIETVEIPSKLTYLGKDVFSGCVDLKTVTINTTAKCNVAALSMGSKTYSLTIGKNVSNEKLVRYFTVDKKYISHSKYFNVINSILYNKDKSRLLRCPRSKSLNKYKFPDSVKTIEEDAFVFCKDVKTVDLNNVKKIKIGAFWYSGLKELVLGTKVEYIGQYAFSDCSELCRLEIYANKKLKISDNAFSDTALVSIDVPCDVGSLAFDNCNNLLELTFSGKIKKISDRAFFDCCCLKTVTIPASVKQIGKYAFGYYYDDWDDDDCDDCLCKVEGFTIKGKKGSAAEKYAKQNGFNFVAVK